MLRLLDVNVLEKRERQELTKVLRILFLPLYHAAPKRALVLYTATIAALLLWLIPVRYRLRPSVTLAFTTISAAILASAAGALESWQDQLDAEQEDTAYDKALHRQAIETVATTQQYANVTAARLQASAVLPEHLREPDLKDPQANQQADFDEFKQLMGVGKKKPLIEGDLDGDGIVDTGNQNKYRVFSRKNAQTGQRERCIDLTGHTHYAGLPIVNVAEEMARESRGCIGIGPTGTGKSDLLKQAIAAQHRIDETSDFSVFAHKSANTARGETLDYCGLEDSQDLYLLTASMGGDVLRDAAANLYSRLKVLDSLMEAGSRVPSIVVIDQVNQGLVAAEKAERQGARSDDDDVPFPYLTETYKESLCTFLVDGREKGIKAWVFGHANTNEALGMGHQIKENVFYLGLGRDGIYSAITNVLKDDRFIAISPIRKALAEKLETYLTAHKEHGNPVNIVLAITNCGSEGWRLVVLPQLPTPEPITLGFTNPPAIGKRQQTPIEKQTRSSPPAADTAKHQTVDAMRAALEQSINASPEKVYPPELTTKATSFIRWIKQNRHNYIDSQGLLDPQVVAFAFDGASGIEEMELILQLITDLGYGTFEEHPHTSFLCWRLQGEKPTYRHLPQPVTDNRPAPPPELEPLPGDISEAQFNLVLHYLVQKQIGIRLTPNGFLTSCHRLVSKESSEKMTTADMRIVLCYLHHKGIVEFPEQGCQSFQFIGLPIQPEELDIPPDASK